MSEGQGSDSSNIFIEPPPGVSFTLLEDLETIRPQFKFKDTELMLSPDKQDSFNQIVADSRAAITSHIGPLIHEDTQFFILHGNTSNSDINPLVIGGEYLGKIGNAHYVALRMPKDIVEARGVFTAEQQEYCRIAVEHELLHQAHAEAIGQMSALQRDLSSDPIERSKINYQYIRSQVDEHPRNRGKGISMASAVTEGTATLGELYLLNKRIEEVGNSDQNDRLSVLKKYRRERINFFKNSLRICRTDIGIRLSAHAFGTPYAVGVAKLMNGLYRKFGMENLAEIVPQIDLDRCRQIRMGSQEFADITADPTLLPGLENVTIT